MTERDALIIMNAVPGLGNRRIRKIRDVLGSLRRLFTLRQSELKGLTRLSDQLVENIIRFPKEKFLQKEYQALKKLHAEIITENDSIYPEILKQIPDAPIVLYIRGRMPDCFGNAIAIVGSRKASCYGRIQAEKIATRLVESGVMIISGMARGIDTAAHRGALKASGTTVAVLGSGLANIYPPENAGLADEIANHGAVITEFAIQTLPKPFNFPRRNRIVSGLSAGVLVVEAAAKSGALITADYALEQGRDVYAVPGMIDQPQSKGVNNLIKQGARLFMGVDDILDEWNTFQSATHADQSGSTVRYTEQHEHSVVAPVVPLKEEERYLLNVFNDAQPLHIEQICMRLDCSLPVCDVLLLQLEMKGCINQLPGKFFIRRRYKEKACDYTNYVK
ncbi:MAG: DNA-processing protein DprA [Candidatus Omnitrophica bacterium]|nr:DNA-processing protein DprA [Candidatus Omnitrophota bacterium]